MKKFLSLVLTLSLLCAGVALAQELSLIHI